MVRWCLSPTLVYWVPTTMVSTFPPSMLHTMKQTIALFVHAGPPLFLVPTEHLRLLSTCASKKQLHITFCKFHLKCQHPSAWPTIDDYVKTPCWSSKWLVVGHVICQYYYLSPQPSGRGSCFLFDQKLAEQLYFHTDLKLFLPMVFFGLVWGPATCLGHMCPFEIDPPVRGTLANFPAHPNRVHWIRYLEIICGVAMHQFLV